jgi:anti-anti-sigma factor
MCDPIQPAPRSPCQPVAVSGSAWEVCSTTPRGNAPTPGLSTMSDSIRSDGLLPLTLTMSRPRPDVCVVQLAGELDIATAPMLADFLREQTADACTDLVLDLAAVSILAAAGLALIVSAQHNEGGVNGRLHLLGVNENRSVRRVLTLTDLIKVLSIHDSVEELLDHLDRS